jgi:hypothetical protein
MNIWGAFFIIVIAAALTLETYCLVTNRQTMSRFVWNLSKAWPPLPLIVGLSFGFLFSHLWWGGSLICY